MTKRRKSVTHGIAVVIGGGMYVIASHASMAQMSEPPSIAAGTPCGQRPYSIALKVEGIREAEGLITVDLHGDNPKEFLKLGTVKLRTRVPAVAPDTTVCIPVEQPGVYAIALYHDRDANRRLNKTWIGLPDEPVGLSNNPPMRMAMPKHEHSAFKVEGPLMPLTIRLHH